MNDFSEQIERFRCSWDEVRGQIAAVIVGADAVIDQTLTCIFSGGHALLEGAPGLGKTLLVRTLAEAMDLQFSRIQFTPDLMPTDITGTMILNTDPDGRRELNFQPGPIFANLVLADEINRATPKTQSAVLEAMQERTVSVARRSHPLAPPFAVLATQNPIEMEGTYPLPEAQVDRFLMKITIPAPTSGDIAAILERTTGETSPVVSAVLDSAGVEECKSIVRRVVAAEPVRRLAAELVARSHPDHPQAPEPVRRYVRYGASPRGAQAMLLSGKVAALRAGRANVARDDILNTAAPAMRHRLILNFEARADEIDPDQIIRALLSDAQSPS